MTTIDLDFVSLDDIVQEDISEYRPPTPKPKITKTTKTTKTKKTRKKKTRKKKELILKPILSTELQERLSYLKKRIYFSRDEDKIKMYQAHIDKLSKREVIQI